MLGLNFWTQSSRYVAPDAAARLIESAPGSATWVGLFVDATPAWVNQVLDSVPLDLLQFHGNETPQYCRQFQRPFMKAFRLRNKDTLTQIPDFTDDNDHPFLVDAYVPDRPGGTGHVVDIELAQQARQLSGQMMLAGGLKPNNVRALISTIQPYGVDVASGVESAPGIKDPAAIGAFLAACEVTPE